MRGNFGDIQKWWIWLLLWWFCSWLYFSWSLTSLLQDWSLMLPSDLHLQHPHHCQHQIHHPHCQDHIHAQRLHRHQQHNNTRIISSAIQHYRFQPHLHFYDTQLLIINIVWMPFNLHNTYHPISVFMYPHHPFHQIEWSDSRANQKGGGSGRSQKDSQCLEGEEMRWGGTSIIIISVIIMAYQQITTSHIPTRWESVIMMKGGNMTQSDSHHTNR